MNIVSIALFWIAAVATVLAIRCIADASKGGDFGQVYSWAWGVVFLAVAATTSVLGVLAQ